MCQKEYCLFLIFLSVTTRATETKLGGHCIVRYKVYVFVVDQKILKETSSRKGVVCF
jgi:hypothetical protein